MGWKTWKWPGSQYLIIVNYIDVDLCCEKQQVCFSKKKKKKIVGVSNRWRLNTSMRNDLCKRGKKQGTVLMKKTKGDKDGEGFG